MKRLAILSGLLALIATAAFISFAPLRAEDPAPANVEKMFKEIKSDLQEIKTELAEIKKTLAEMKAAPVKPEPHPANQEEAALKVAGQWFDAFVKRDIKAIMPTMGLPFAFDGDIIETEEDLLKEVKGVLEEDWGEISNVQYETIKSYKPSKEENEIIRRVLPGGGTFVRISVTVEGDNEAVIIYIRPGDNPKIVGFKD